MNNKSEHDASSIGGLILWLNLRIQYWCTYLHNDITYCGLLEWIEWINCVVARTKIETTSFGDMIIVSFFLKITLFFILGFFLLDNAEMGDGARSISRSAVLFLFCFSRTARRYTSTYEYHAQHNKQLLLLLGAWGRSNVQTHSVESWFERPIWNSEPLTIGAVLSYKRRKQFLWWSEKRPWCGVLIFKICEWRINWRLGHGATQAWLSWGLVRSIDPWCAN